MTNELTRREILGQLAKAGFVLMAAPALGSAWVNVGNSAGAADVQIGQEVALDDIEGTATTASRHRGKLVLAVMTEDGPLLLARRSNETLWSVVAGPDDFPPLSYVRSLVSYKDSLLVLGNTWLKLDPVDFPIDDDPDYFDPEDPDVVPFPPGTVIREERASIRPLLATSSDLASWRVVEDASVETGSFAGAFSVGGQLMIVGELFESPVVSADSIGAVVTSSTDLVEWESLPLAGEAVPSHGGFVGVAAVPSGGALAVVADTAGVRLLETGDGVEWTRSEMPPESDAIQVIGVAAVPGGVAIAGLQGEALRAWTRNGPHWREMAISAEGDMAGISAIGAELLLLGMEHDHTPLVVAEGI